MTNSPKMIRPKSESKTRIQFDFSQDALEKLDEIVAETSAASRAEIVRVSVAFLRMAIKARTNGADVYFINQQTGEKDRVLLPL